MRALISAPSQISSLTTASYPSFTAMCNGVRLNSSVSSVSAPAMNSDWKHKTIYFPLTIMFSMAFHMDTSGYRQIAPSGCTMFGQDVLMVSYKGYNRIRMDNVPKFWLLSSFQVVWRRLAGAGGSLGWVSTKYVSRLVPNILDTEVDQRSLISVLVSHIDQFNLPPDTDWIHSPVRAGCILALPKVFVQLESLKLLQLHAQKDETDNNHILSFQGFQGDVYHRLEPCVDRLQTSFLCWSDINQSRFY